MRGFTKGRLLATSCAFTLGFSMPGDPAWFDPQEHDGISYDASIDSENGGHVVIKVPGQQPQHGTLTDFFTFTRNSVATYRGPGGFVKYANENLLLQSQTLDNVAWTQAAVTVNANTTLTRAPDGTQTADQLVETATTAPHFISQSITKPATRLQYTMSAFMKANTRRYAHFRIQNTGPTADIRATFDLIAGVVTVTQGGVNMDANSAAMTPAGDGWWRCTFVITHDATVDLTCTLGLSLDTTAVYSYAGDGTSSIFVWGVQMQRGMFHGKYLPTVAAAKFDQPRVEWNQQFTYNLSGSSEDFRNLGFFRVSTGILPVEPGVALAPNGTMSASRVTQDTAVASIHRMRQTTDIPMPVGSPISYSIHVKAQKAKRCSLMVTDGAFLHGSDWHFDLANGTHSAGTPFGTVSGVAGFMQDVGNGWWRIGLTVIPGGTTTNARCLFQLTDPNGATTFTGDGVSDLLVWGDQTTFTTTHLPYIKTPDVSTTPAYGSYNETCKGLMVETNAINLALWSQDLDQAAWTKADCTITANAVVAPDGSITGDRMVETATVSAIHGVIAGQTITAGAVTVISAFVRPGERDKFFLYGINVDQFGAIFDLSTMTTANITSGVGTVSAKGIIPYANGWYRIWVSGVLNGAATTINTVAGLAINLTVPGGYTYTGNTSSGGFMWGIQVETGMFNGQPSTYVPSFSTATLRIADGDVRTLGAEFTVARGTVLTRGTNNQGLSPSNAEFFWNFDDGTTTNRMGLIKTAGGPNINFRVMNTSVFVNLNDLVAALGEKFTHAVTWDATNSTVSKNGTAPQTTAFTGALPVVPQLSLLSATSAGSPCNSNLLSFDYWPETRTPAVVQAMAS